jgi:glycosyltransferase involved in cell wall biosynthesis
MRFPTFKDVASGLQKRLLKMERSLANQDPISAQDSITDKDYNRLLDRFYASNSAQIDGLRVSVIMPTHNRADSIGKAIDSILAQSHQNYEVIVCDDGSTDDTLKLLQERFGSVERIRVLPLERGGVSRARNSGLDVAGGDFIAFLDSDNTWTPDYLRKMISVCHSERTDIAYSGLALLDAAGKPKLFRGQEFDRDTCRERNYVDLNVYFYRRTAELDFRFDPDLKRMVDWDFILRQTKDQKVVFAPFVGCLYADDLGDVSRITVKEPNLYWSIVRARHFNHEPVPNSELSEAVKFSIAIKTPAPKKWANEWGDFHYAVSLAKSFNKLGHKTRIDFLEDWSSRRHDRSDDIVIVLRGLSVYEPRPGAFNILWNISHADQVSLDELDRYDLVYTASESTARLFANLTDTPVRTLYQATDTARFNPDRRCAHLEHDLLFTGNSRNVYRDMVRWTVDLGLKPAIYGAQWERFIPPSLVHGENIANDRLGKYYASAKVLLNDHWESMREFGMLSNRLFDGLASNAVVVSDAIPTLSSVFGDGVIQVASQDDLRRALLEMPEDQKAKSEAIGQIIRERHSFAARARTIVDDVLRHVGIETPERTEASPFIHRNSPIRVGLLAASNGRHFQSSLYLRLLAPLTAEAAVNRYDVRCLRPDQVDQIGAMDVAVVQRAVCEQARDAERVVDICAGGKVKLVTDLDDGFIHIDTDHPEYEVYRHRNDGIRVLMNSADESWFSTEHLMNTYAGDCKNAVVIENRLDPRFWRNFRQQRSIFQNKAAHILYMGTATHDPDFNMLLDQLDVLHGRAPDSFRLTIIGAVRNPPERRWLSTLAPDSNSRMYPRFTKWLLRANDFDVGLCPLVGNRFNDCKSDLKILDYAALGLVPVVSDCIPYTATATANACAVVVPSQGDWADTLQSVIRDRERSRQIADNATRYLWSQRHVAQSTKAMGDRLSGLL